MVAISHFYKGSNPSFSAKAKTVAAVVKAYCRNGFLYFQRLKISTKKYGKMQSIDVKLMSKKYRLRRGGERGGTGHLEPLEPRLTDAPSSEDQAT